MRRPTVRLRVGMKTGKFGSLHDLGVPQVFNLHPPCFALNPIVAAEVKTDVVMIYGDAYEPGFYQVCEVLVNEFLHPPETKTL